MFARAVFFEYSVRLLVEQERLSYNLIVVRLSAVPAEQDMRRQRKEFFMEIDARGLSCPLPVIKTKKALAEAENRQVEVLLDEEVALENVRRLARDKGYTVQVAEENGEYRLTLTPEDA